MVKPKRKKSKLPKQTVVNVFVISRVPENGAPITYGELYKTLERDLELAAEKGFKFESWSKLSLRAAVRAVFDRYLLSCPEAYRILDRSTYLSKESEVELAGLLVTRNERTVRYMNKVPPKVRDIVDKIPTSNLLMLLAGMAE